MKQILAMFLKDARRFWPEILVCCGLLIGLVLVYPATWRMEVESVNMARSRFFGGEGPVGMLADSLVVLIPIGWLVLIARAVHCERLVGDTQYWLTRPYDWRKLFASKLLFLAAFLYAPFFIAQCVLLAEGGFHPGHYLGALLFNLVLLTVVGVLPLVALSSITRGFGRLMLVLLGLALVVVAAAAGNAFVPSDSVSSLPDLLSGNLGLGAIFCGSLAASLLMYALRKARMGWLILIALTLVMCSTAFFDPDRMLVDDYFPPLSNGSVAPLTVAYAGTEFSQPPANESTDKRAVDISIPAIVSGVQPEYAAIPQAVKVTMTDAGGRSWESPWQGYGPEHYLSGAFHTSIRFRILRSVYDRFKGSPVTLRISIAVAMARKSSQSTIPLPQGDFAVPEIGVCKPEHWIWRPNEIRGIACRSAMNSPQLTYISIPWTSGECGAVNANPKQSTGNVWTGDLDPGPAEFGITSVWDAPVYMSVPQFTRPVGGSEEKWSLCAGTPVSFAQYRPAARLREEMTIPGFHLPELSIGDVMMKLLLPQ